MAGTATPISRPPRKRAIGKVRQFKVTIEEPNRSKVVIVRAANRIMSQAFEGKGIPAVAAIPPS